MFLPAGFLVEALREVSQISRFLDDEFGQLERWGRQHDLERYDEWKRAVERLAECCRHAQAVAERLRCDPLVYIGDLDTGQVLAVLERVWPSPDEPVPVDQADATGYNE